MTDVRFELLDYDKLVRMFDGAKAIIDAEIESTAQRIVLGIEADARRAVAQDTRDLMRSIASEVTPIGGGIEGIVRVGAPYGRFVEEGRRPGKMPPVEELRGWARRHGIPEQGVYALARAIGKRGTKAQPFFWPAVDKRAGTVKGAFEDAMQRAAQKLAEAAS